MQSIARGGMALIRPTSSLSWALLDPMPNFPGNDKLAPLLPVCLWVRKLIVYIGQSFEFDVNVLGPNLGQLRQPNTLSLSSTSPWVVAIYD
jgi:hypothetical protein